VKKSLQLTFETLRKSRNDAVVPVLISTLDRTEGSVLEGAVKTLISRRNSEGHLAVIRRWHALNPDQRRLLKPGRGRITTALRDAIVSGDPQLFENACELIVEFSDFDLIPVLVTLAEDRSSPQALPATKLILKLADRLRKMVHGTRDYSDRRDPQSLRRFALASLERSASHYRRHRRSELVEAFVILASTSSGTLRTILNDPHHACFQVVIQTLTHSESAIDLLLSFLQVDRTPQTVLNAMSHRVDAAFVSRLLQYASEEMTPAGRRNLSLIQSFSCLKPQHLSCSALSVVDRQRSVALAEASGMQSDDMLELIETLLLSDEVPQVRAAACAGLASLQSDRADRLILQAMQDEAPEVEAAAALLLRKRRITGSLSKLVQLLDSPHEIVRDAARQALADFSFRTFSARYETLPDKVRRGTGELVVKIDPQAIPELVSELQATGYQRRLKAIAMAKSLKVVQRIAQTLIELLGDEEHLIRAAAAEALQECPTAEVQLALLQASQDHSSVVQSAAKNSLASMANPAISPPADPPTSQEVAR